MDNNIFKISTTNFLRVKGGRLLIFDYLTAICEPIVSNMWERRLLITLQESKTSKNKQTNSVV
jgi:hypothetical protein